MNKISLSAVFMLLLASCFDFHQAAVLRHKNEEQIHRNDTSANSTSDLVQGLGPMVKAGEQILRNDTPVNSTSAVMRLEADEQIQQNDTFVDFTSELSRHTRFPTVRIIDDTQLNAELIDVMERLVNINGSAFELLKNYRELRPFVGDECSPLEEFNLPTVPSSMSGNKTVMLNTIKGLMRTISDMVEVASHEEITRTCPGVAIDSLCDDPTNIHTNCWTQTPEVVEIVCRMSRLRLPEPWTAATPTPTFVYQSKFKLYQFTASVLCRELEMIAEFVKNIVQVLG